MYDPNILLELDFHKSPAKFNPFISAAAPGKNFFQILFNKTKKKYFDFFR